MAPKHALTTGEVARYCGVNFRTVIRWVERGHLKAYELPGRGDKRIMLPDFVAFLTENRMPVPEDLQQYQPSNYILIVDDEPGMASAIKRTVLDTGLTPLVAHDGFQAGTLLSLYRPQVMTLDLNMPGMNGFKVLEFVRKTEGLENVKILVISALPESSLQRALEAGADDVLGKPFEDDVLLDKVTMLAGLQAVSG